MKWEPKPWHPVALQAAIEQPKVALWLKMGLGKTAIAATAVDELIDRGLVNRVLVVGPVRVIESVWPAELRKWDHLANIPYRLVRGSAGQRAALLDTPWHGIEMISYETLTWLLRDWGRRRALPWDMVIFDEVSKLKSVSTMRFRALRRRCAEMPRVLELTGSPAPSGLTGIWAPIYVLDQGERLGKTYTQFGGYLPRWFRIRDNGWGYEPLPHAEREIHERIQDIVVSMKIEDYVDDLPPLTETDVWVDMPPRAMADYRELENEMFVALRRGEVEAVNGAVLTGKCRQLANGAAYINRTRDWEEVHRTKLEALDDIIQEMEGNPLLVAYQFRSDLERLKRAYPRAATLEDPKTAPRVIDEWNEGKHSMLLIHPASAGHGLNLQDGGDSVAFFGCGYSYDQYEQTVARLAGGLRRKRPTFVYRIVARGTIDATVLEVLASRRTVQEVLMDRLRAAESAGEPA